MMEFEHGHIPTLTHALMGYQIPDGSLAFFAHDGQRTKVGVFTERPTPKDLRHALDGINPVWLQGFGMSGGRKLWQLTAELEEIDNQHLINHTGHNIPAPLIEVAGAIVVVENTWRDQDLDTVNPVLTLTPQMQRMVGQKPALDPDELFARLTVRNPKEFITTRDYEVSGKAVAGITNQYPPISRAQFAVFMLEGLAHNAPWRGEEETFFQTHTGATRRGILTHMANDSVAGWAMVGRCLADPPLTATLVELARTAPKQDAGVLRTLAAHAMYFNGHDGLSSIPSSIIANYVEPYAPHLATAKSLHLAALEGPAPSWTQSAVRQEIEELITKPLETSPSLKPTTPTLTMTAAPSTSPPTPTL